MVKPEVCPEQPKKYFYALKDHGESFFFKIGISGAHPSTRASSVARETDRDFRLFCYVIVRDARSIETNAKQLLDGYCVNGSEFLTIPAEKLLAVFRMLEAAGGNLTIFENAMPCVRMPRTTVYRCSPLSSAQIFAALEVVGRPINNRELSILLDQSEASMCRQLKALEASGQVIRQRCGREVLTVRANDAGAIHLGVAESHKEAVNGGDYELH